MNSAMMPGAWTLVLAMLSPPDPAAPSNAASPSAAAPSAAAPGEPAAADPSASQPWMFPTSKAEREAIRLELERGLKGLHLPDAPRPYRAEARVVRAGLLSIDGSYGGLITDVLQRQSTGTVEVRVGTVARDNSNFFGGEGGVARFDVPEEPSGALLRKRLWLALDRAFRGATQGFAAKQVALQRLAVEELPPDNSPAPPAVTRTAELGPAPIDRTALGAAIGALSVEFARWPNIDNGDVHLQVLRSQETVVSTDGLDAQWAHDRAVLAVVADTKAPDGMVLDHGLALHLQHVPTSAAELLELGKPLVERVLAELDELSRAPMIDEEYDGPLLFRSVAAAQLLASTVATEAVGTPPPLADGGRLMDLEPAWHKRLGKVVMPPFIDLVDDPSLDAFGRMEIDAEGVTPERLVLVQGGVLQTLLMTRTPNAMLGKSNGRARMSPALESGPAITNLELHSRRRGLTDAALERELLARAREDGYEFAYIIETLRDGSVLGSVPRESAAAYAGTGKLDLPLPARVFRIEPGGKKTLVRGAVLAPASVRVLRRIRAVGQHSAAVPMRIPVGAFGGFNSDSGIDGVLSQTVDVQVTCPDLLIDGLELLVERGEHEKAPTLRHPLRREAPADPPAETEAPPQAAGPAPP